MIDFQIETLEVKNLLRSHLPHKRLSQSFRASSVDLLGNMEILTTPLLGLYAPNRAHGSLILKSIEMARALRDRKIAVLSRFQTPLELEFLHFLSKGTQPIAKIVDQNVSISENDDVYKKLLAENRLILIKPKSQMSKNERHQSLAGSDLLKILSDSLLLTHYEKLDSPVSAKELSSIGSLPIYTIDPVPGEIGIKVVSAKDAGIMIQAGRPIDARKTGN